MALNRTIGRNRWASSDRAMQRHRLSGIDDSPALARQANHGLVPFPPTLFPRWAVVPAGGQLTFRLRMRGGPPAALHWQVVPDGCGGHVQAIPDGRAVFTAPAAVGKCRIRAVCPDQPSMFAEAVVEVLGCEQVELYPESATAVAGQPVTFKASTAGPPDSTIGWSCTPSVGVVWSARSGLEVRWRASREGTYRVRATIGSDPGRWAESVVTVLAPLRLTIFPVSTILKGLCRQRLSAKVDGTTDHRLLWSTTGGGTLRPLPDGTVEFEALPRPGAYQVTATSLADPTRSAHCTITIPDDHSEILTFGLSSQTFTLSRSSLPSDGDSHRFVVFLTGTNQAGGPGFNGGSDCSVDAAAGTARTIGYSSTTLSNGTISAMTSIEWLVPASIPLGTHVLRVRTWARPHPEASISLVVVP